MKKLTRTEEAVRFEAEIQNQTLYDYPAKGEHARLVNSYTMPRSFTMPFRYTFDFPYLVTNKGQVINAETGIILPQYLSKSVKDKHADKAYLKVSLRQDGQWVMHSVSRLTAFVWCDNAKCKRCVHHIDVNPRNNRAENLIFVNDEEHSCARNLILAGDMKTYYEFIDEVRRDNEGVKNGRWIKNPQYGQIEDAYFGTHLMLTPNGYEEYMQRRDMRDVPYEDVIGEYWASRFPYDGDIMG